MMMIYEAAVFESVPCRADNHEYIRVVRGQASMEESDSVKYNGDDDDI
jgi:hypothetical protein